MKGEQSHDLINWYTEKVKWYTTEDEHVIKSHYMTSDVKWGS